MTNPWPILDDVNHSFVREYMRRPIQLFNHVATKQSGSGRPSGPREVYWASVSTLCVASLEAGLEDLIFAAHGVRVAAEGSIIVQGTNSPDRNPRKWLVSDRLMAPSLVKVERILFGDFGILMGQLPSAAQFHLMSKPKARGGAGRGAPVAASTQWTGLAELWEVLSYIRNATAHGDADKYGRRPGSAAGTLWVPLENGRWSVQMPHALSAIRVSIAIFNSIASAIHAKLNYPKALLLVSPDVIKYPH